MSAGLLFLLALLCTSCASVTGGYIAATKLSIDTPQYAKGFEIRKNGEMYIIEYDYGSVSTYAKDLTGATFGYPNFASLDSRILGRLCHGDPLPILNKQDLI